MTSSLPDAVPTGPRPTPRALPGGHERLGMAAVLVGALLFAANATASKLAMEAGVSAEHLVQVRTCGTALVLLVVVGITRPASLRVSWRDLAGLAVYGLVGIAAVQFLYSQAIARLPVGLALLLEYTAPLMVAGWVRVVQHQPLRKRIFAALACCLGGLALVAQVGGAIQLSWVGVAAALGAAVCLAAYFVMGAHVVRSRDVYSTLTWSMVVAAVFWTVLAPPWTMSWDTMGTAVPLDGVGTLPLWGVLVFVVVGGTALPYLLELWALSPLGAARTSLLAMAEPVLAAAIAWILMGETMTGWQVAGGVAVLVGIGLAETARAHHPPPAALQEITQN